MNQILEEILEIPARGNDFWSSTPSYTLPLGVPYLGMGSSYFSPPAFKYMGVKIFPELASEYYTHLRNKDKFPHAVILSQSGKSSEALWCTGLFERYTAVTNNVTSELANGVNVGEVVSIMAGEEHYSSSKTYTNTLLALFKGFRNRCINCVKSIVVGIGYENA
jgi:glucosamine--fructose-6-phosphate aminotransferase (isomerizing)